MNLTFFFDHRFYLHPGDEVRSRTHYNYSLFANRYLREFEQVKIVTRLFPADASISVDLNREYRLGEGVSIVPLDSTGGFRGFVGNRAKIAKAIDRELERAEAVLLVAPGAVASMAYAQMRRTKRPYGMEVVSDPYEVFAPGSTSVPLRPLWRWLSPRQLREQCAHAATVSYVTENTIQKRYPPAEATFTTHYSSIELSGEAYASALPEEPSAPPWRLVTVGSMAQMNKGFDVLLKAVAHCRQQGFDVLLTLLGDGRHRTDLESMAKELGLGDSVRFLGFLPPGDPVRAELDAAHLFVLPSRGEGLPRAMIEAMARGKACIGTQISGIPELLPPECLFPLNDDVTLAARIGGLLRDGDKRRELAARNFEKSRDYDAAILNERRLRHYRALREATEKWQGEKSR